MKREIAVILGVVAATYVGTAVIRRLALRRAWLDIPNQRSSHTTPTPRGGGIAVAVAVLGGTWIATAVGLVPEPLAVAAIGGGALVTLVGWLDDRKGLPALLRITVHLAAAIIAVTALGGLPEIRIGTVSVALGALGSVLAVILIAWCINLYNFMDGIDGIAGAEACSVALVGALCSLKAPGVGFLALALAGAAMAFLVWNWAPARIFLGDAGSGLIGYLLAVLAIASERSGGLPLVLWMVLLGAFAFDATLTLMRRLIRGEAWYLAHRKHAYQRLAVAGWPHGRVVSGLLLVNALLGGLVLVAWRWPSIAPVSIAASVLLLGVVYCLIERRSPMYAPHAEGD